MYSQEYILTTRQIKIRQHRVVHMIALTICAFFIAVLLLSGTYIIIYSNHSHDQDGPGGTCDTCMHLEAANSLLETISTKIVTGGVTLGAFALVYSLCPYYVIIKSFSLVSLKVRMNN